MESTVVAGLLVGTVGVGLIFWLSRAATQRYAGRSPEIAPAPPKSDAELLRATRQTYTRILFIRLTGLILCLIAGILLYIQAGMLLSLLFAGAGCLLQYIAYRVRTQHVLSVTEASIQAASAEMRSAHAQKSAVSEQDIS